MVICVSANVQTHTALNKYKHTGVIADRYLSLCTGVIACKYMSLCMVSNIKQAGKPCMYKLLEEISFTHAYKH